MSGATITSTLPKATTSTANRPSRTGGVAGSYGCAANYYVPTIEELRNPSAKNQTLATQGREEWAINKEIAKVGEWEVVTPVATPTSSSSNKTRKDDHQTTTHDQAPEFQDDDDDHTVEDLNSFKIKEKEYPDEAYHHHQEVHEEVVFKKQNNLEGWVAVIISSTACIVGASIVFIDTLFHKPLLDNRSFMASSMSLASGVLLFSSLAVLLPQSQKRLNNDTLLYTCFFAGAAFTSILTRLIHYLMPNAIHACGDSSEACDEDQERQRLGKHRYDVEYGTMKSSESHFRFHHEDQQQQQNGENSLNEPSTHDHHHHNHHHHESMEEVVANDPKHYFSIGIQTAIAICVHKFPEGLVMLISTKASASLGLSVCIAMSVHNLTEGFMIALPLYYATRSKMTAFISAAFMGGLSQPLGALVGLLLIENISKPKEDMLFGIVFGCVSGMMTLITIQSMLPQAIRADIHQHYVLAFFFLGIFLVGTSSILGSL
ncbi:hypothetical protein G6F57_008725 [Rhizopus arrhizus]|uniref:Zinc/iron permease n=1 Tax=Rhizopus oryzae TaxID=64495 RepID=A0A9P6XGW7_RHIOR|nr:hypothetical protein G6F23_004030 [Rhizopus arrhizus]KAG0759889.1 hypothetical protein G6F24_008738 [Rhizopus arrhizus]KAG0789808.1 hypothetical protein G6F21_006253 [Rhizopus arrhizus]KAG0800605.1 hypothetical protein G6F22_002068 [Rhizopus arrhizus]KAG0808815.1 hypothetical protein G6F20_009268 [Rhizopus arrhizus]